MHAVALQLLILLAGLNAMNANYPMHAYHPEAGEEEDPFYYDWHKLRIGGLICAGVLCATGFIVLLSGKCKCKFRQKPSHRSGEGPPLITPVTLQVGNQGSGYPTYFPRLRKRTTRRAGPGQLARPEAAEEVPKPSWETA